MSLLYQLVTWPTSLRHESNKPIGNKECTARTFRLVSENGESLMFEIRKDSGFPIYDFVFSFKSLHSRINFKFLDLHKTALDLPCGYWAEIFCNVLFFPSHFIWSFSVFEVIKSVKSTWNHTVITHWFGDWSSV